MFLEKSPERLTRRTRIERWLLLALRCLALIALALLFGRPYLKSSSLDSEEKSGTRALILVDKSASMHRENLWQQALDAAKKSLETFESQDAVALALFDENLELVGDFNSWQGLSPQGALVPFFPNGSRNRRNSRATPKGNSPSWLPTDLGASLAKAVDLVSGGGSENASRYEIVLISDFQEGAARDSLNQLAWPEEVEVECIKVTPKKEGNLSVSLASAAPGGGDNNAADDSETTHRIRVSNSVASDSEKFSMEWEGHPETRVESYLSPGTSRVLRTPPVPANDGTSVLLIKGDTHDFDNRVYIAAAQPRPLPVLFLAEKIELGKAGSSLFYLQRALNETPSLRPNVTAKNFSEVAASQLPKESEAIVVQGNWPESLATSLHNFAKKGGPGHRAAVYGNDTRKFFRPSRRAGLETRRSRNKELRHAGRSRF